MPLKLIWNGALSAVPVGDTVKSLGAVLVASRPVFCPPSVICCGETSTVSLLAGVPVTFSDTVAMPLGFSAVTGTVAWNCTAMGCCVGSYTVGPATDVGGEVAVS